MTLPSQSQSQSQSRRRQSSPDYHTNYQHCPLEQLDMVFAQFLIPQFTSLCSKFSPTNLNILNRVSSPNICFWDTLTRAHCKKSEINKCFLVFKRMTRDRYTFPFLIEACSNALAVREEGRITHGLSMMYGVEGDMFARSSLIDFYGKRQDIKCGGKVFDGLRCVTAESLNFGDLLRAKCLFDEMPVKSLATWNAMIKGLVMLGELKSARILFDEMPERNKVSFTTMIDGYAKVGDMVAARWLFDELPEKDLFSWSALISGYVQNGEPFEVVKVFPEMWAMSVKPDEFIMVSLTSACSQLGFLELAELVDSYMSQHADFSAVLLTAKSMPRNMVVGLLIYEYGKAGDMVAARRSFDGLVEKDLISWSALISGYLQNGEPFEVVKVFPEMWGMNVKADEFIMVSLMSACSQLGFLELAKLVDSYMRGRADVSVAHLDVNAMLKFTEKIPKLEYFSHSILAVALLERMINEGPRPNDVAFHVILKACMHLGLVEDWRRYFDLMINEYSLSPSPDHYECMVNLLVDSGKLRAAYELIKSIPVEPHFRSWGALLGAYKLYFDPDSAEVVEWLLVDSIPVERTSWDPHLVVCELYFDTDFRKEIRWKLIELRDHCDPDILSNIHVEARRWRYRAINDAEYGKQLMSG